MNPDRSTGTLRAHDGRCVLTAEGRVLDWMFERSDALFDCGADARIPR